MNKWKRSDWQIQAVIGLVEEKLLPLIKKNIKDGCGLLCGMSRADMAEVIEHHHPCTEADQIIRDATRELMKENDLLRRMGREMDKVYEATKSSLAKAEEENERLGQELYIAREGEPS